MRRCYRGSRLAVRRVRAEQWALGTPHPAGIRVAARTADASVADVVRAIAQNGGKLPAEDAEARSA
ncbi:MAG: hypothetical protein H0T04_03860 [Chloroflexi bacterium]|nr:hypothetical protein [Chloroflexota bacterium]